MTKKLHFTLKKTIILLLILITLTGTDLIVKAKMEKDLQYGKEIIIIPGFWSYYYVQNHDIGFSVLTFLNNTINAEQKIILLITLQLVAAGVAIGIYYYFKEWKYSLPVALMASGGLGNAIDRIIRGYVVDYVKWRYKSFIWPIFNLADVFAVIGVFSLIIVFIKFGDNTHKKKELLKDK